MKVFDKILSICLIIYLVWISYYRLFGDQSAIIKQIYFLFEGVTFFIVLLRIYIEKWIPIVLFNTRYIIFIMLCFKLFQITYILFKISPDYSSWIITNNDNIWSFVGVLLIMSLLGYPVVHKLYKKWVKK